MKFNLRSFGHRPQDDKEVEENMGQQFNRREKRKRAKARQKRKKKAASKAKKAQK